MQNKTLPIKVVIKGVKKNVCAKVKSCDFVKSVSMKLKIRKMLYICVAKTTDNT